MAYVNQKLQQYSNGNVGLMDDFCYRITVHVPSTNIGQIWNANFLKTYYVQKVGFPQIFSECYPLDACYDLSHGQYTEIPNTLPNSTTGLVLGNSVSPSVYDTWLNNNLNAGRCFFETGVWNDWGSMCNNFTTPQMQGYFRSDMQICNSLSKSCGIPFIYMPQAHQWFTNYEVHRQPTNEELDMMANIAVSYGAKGLLYFEYPSFTSPAYYGPFGKKPSDPGDYGICIANNWGGQLISSNVYNETKPMWQQYKDIVDRTGKWSSYLTDFINQTSYIYEHEGERCDMRQNNYINSLAAYHYGTPQQCPSDICNNNQSVQPQDVQGLVCDCPDNTYLQVATFWLPVYQRAYPYFMIVNRRCSPAPDGNRDVRIYFNPSNIALQGYNNWLIKDLYNDNSQTITLNPNNWVDLGWFNPGEGRLYQMVPSVIGGGTLLADETLPQGDITVIDTVFNGGYNIYISSGTNLHFTDTSTFVMNGGTFTMGNAQQQGAPDISMGPASGSTFHGLYFNNCNVNIYNTAFGNLVNDTSSYALNMVDCPVVDIRNNSFTFSNQSLNGGINLVYYDNTITPNIYIGANSFSSDISSLPAINAMSYAGVTCPLLIENNIFISNTINRSYSLLLSGIVGGVVKSCTFSNSDRAISCLSSSIDFAENTINSNNTGTKSIECLSGSEVRLTRSGAYYLGGLNTINNTGTSSDNIYVENSDFLLDQGQNIFNIADNTSCYHLTGYFPALLPVSTSEIYNCFKINNTPVDPPIEHVTLGDGGNNILFTFTPYLPECTSGGGLGSNAIVNLGNGIFDTIQTYNGGGGGEHSFLIVLSLKQMYDSICIQMRYRNYNYVKTKCMDLITAYPDSLQSLNAISKLYLSTSATDTTNSGLTVLKTFYENLILNNGDNTPLVARCYYYIQKCKVLLKDYTGAMSGFQTIINNNPYSYEGLVARWDFMATSLLMNGHGGGENEPEIIKDELQTDGLSGAVGYDDNPGPRDKSPWNKEQKQTIKKSINTTIISTRNAENRRINDLQKQADNGNENAKIQLKVVKTLKDIIKTQKPKNIIEHIKIVSSDIQKIVNAASGRKPGKVTNNIPTVFSLSQNFPNPFNPSTTIKYALPKDVKVTIKVYDILGKLVTTIINGELKKAGYYEERFDGSNYASGVYFYRIQAGEFVQSKKMVLVK